MQKHMLTSHEDCQCKECHEKLSTFKDLLKHVAKHHFKDEDGSKDNNTEEDKIEKQDHSVKEKDKVSDSLLEDMEDFEKK